MRVMYGWDLLYPKHKMHTMSKSIRNIYSHMYGIRGEALPERTHHYRNGCTRAPFFAFATYVRFTVVVVVVVIGMVGLLGK